jgi:lysozyme
MTQTLNVEYRKVEMLIPFARNPRTHSDAQIAKLAASIVEFGWTNPVLVDGVREAEVYLAGDLVTALRATLRYCPVLATEPENRLAAIVDFTFNLGAGRLQTSTLRRRINQLDWSAAASELRRWVRGGGRVLPGLVVRRQVESQLLAR